jgi:Tfp pilus assembly protein PilN
MIKINLHDYREELRKIEVQKRIVRGIYLFAIIPVLIAASWLMENMKLEQINVEVRELETQVKALEGDVKEIEGMKAKIKRGEMILAGIEKLRHDQMQATRILGDVNLRVPKDMWLTQITQKSKDDLKRSKVSNVLFEDPAILEQANQKKKKKKKRKKEESPEFEFLEITGRAFKEQTVVSYINELETVPYFKLIFLHRTQRQLMGVYPVYEFVIYCYIPKDAKTVT